MNVIISVQEVGHSAVERAVQLYYIVGCARTTRPTTTTSCIVKLTAPLAADVDAGMPDSENYDPLSLAASNIHRPATFDRMRKGRKS